MVDLVYSVVSDIGQGKAVPLPCLPDSEMLCLLGPSNYLLIIPNSCPDSIPMSETQPCTLHGDFLIQNATGGQLQHCALALLVSRLHALCAFPLDYTSNHSK